MSSPSSRHSLWSPSMLELSQFLIVAEALLTLPIRMKVFLLMLSSIPLIVQPFVSSSSSSSKSRAKSYFPSSSLSALTVGASASASSAYSASSPSCSALAFSLASFLSLYSFCSACWTLQKCHMSLKGCLKLQLVMFAATFVTLPRPSNQSPSTIPSCLNWWNAAVKSLAA